MVKKIYYFFVNIVMFFIPILLMSICYSMIVAKLYCTASPGERVGGVSPQARAKRKVVKLVLVVIATFVICWSPHQVPMAHAIFSQTHLVNECQILGRVPDIYQPMVSASSLAERQ